MPVSEYGARFHKLFHHATMILLIGEEIVWCFVCGFRLQLWIEAKSMVFTGHSFLDVVVHAGTIE